MKKKKQINHEKDRHSTPPETGKFIEVQPKAYESYNELGKLVIQKRIEMKEKHLYITALNAKNAARKFIKFIEKASDEAPRHYESKNYY